MIQFTQRVCKQLFLALFLLFTLNAYSQLGQVENYSSNNKHVLINTTNGSITITPYSDSIVQVLPKLGDNAPNPKSSASVVMNPNAKFSVLENPQSINIKISNLIVNVDKNTSLVSFYSNNNLLLSEQSSVVRAGKEKIYSFFNTGNESLYGGGERGQSVDLQGDTLIMYNKQNYGYGKGDRTSQMNITMPFYMSSSGYGVFFDDYSASKLILKKPIQYITSINAPVAYYFILGNKQNMGAVVKNFTALVGRQELAPFWTLGYITSKYGYKTQSETEAVIDTLKTNGYPVDGIVLDLFWYGKETDMGRFAWNPQQWPNPEQMISNLKNKGVNLVTISQPYLNKIGAIDNYNMAVKEKMLGVDEKGRVLDVQTWVGEAGMLDVSNKATQEWMWEQYRKSLDQGVTGLWGDLGEPEVHPLGMYHSNGETAAEYHNRYGNDWSAIIYNGIKNEYPNMRPMLLMRGGTAGLQRYSVFPWSTDVSRSWGGLQAQIPIMINSSLSGLGYMSHDVGGFAVDRSHPTDTELYARWLQLGLFTPVLRTHSTFAAEPYHYTEPGYQDLFKKIIKERYQWLPYNYTLAYKNAISGAPFVRPMNYFDPQNKELSNIEDQYFWGDEVIVAPVIEKGAKSRKVILPQGIWYDYNNPAITYQGPTTINYNAPIDVLPLFVKAGSFIPSANYKMNNTTEYNSSNYKITYYPGTGKSSYTLFEDDRANPNSIEQKEYMLFTLHADNTADKLNFFIDLQGKGYKGMLKSHMITFEIPNIKEPKSIKIDSHKVVEAHTLDAWIPGAYYYDEVTHTLYFKTFINKDLKIDIVK